MSNVPKRKPIHRAWHIVFATLMILLALGVGLPKQPESVALGFIVAFEIVSLLWVLAMLMVARRGDVRDICLFVSYPTVSIVILLFML